MNSRFKIVSILSLLLICSTIVHGQLDKPRIIITADPELDDNNSLIRFLTVQQRCESGGSDLCKQWLPLERRW
jgi:hypothetical protein